MATVYTSVGEAMVCDMIHAGSACYIGWGTGAGSAAKGSTDLSTPATEARVAGAETQPSADICQWVATITADGNKTITNAGLFDAAGSGSPPSGGNLLIHGDGINTALLTGDKIEFTITLEQT